MRIVFLEEQHVLDLPDAAFEALYKRLETVKGRNAFARAMKDSRYTGSIRVHSAGCVISNRDDKKEDNKDLKFHLDVEKVRHDLQAMGVPTTTYYVMTEMWIREGGYRENGWTEEQIRAEHLKQHAKAIIKQLKEEDAS